MKILRLLTFIAVFALAGRPSGAFGQTPTNLWTFGTGGDQGYFPFESLVQATDGNFYGTVGSGGTSNDGAVFRITPTGTLTNLHSFTGSDGAFPSAELVQGSDGYFYGTTSEGGTSTNCGGGCGTVFQMTPTGTLTNLHSFTGLDGANPQAALVEGSDGNFYGTTYGDGLSSSGTVFRISPTGTLTNLHQFSGPDGAFPYAGLLLAGDGNFYGTTYLGGASGSGTVFRISPTGTLTNLHSFSGPDGASPRAALVEGTDGNFYGTTYAGGTSGSGAVFRITMSGSLTNLHSFSGADGGNSWAALVLGSDGNFYGTTYLGGTGKDGTIFRITPSGSLTNLHMFAGGTDGAFPQDALIQGSDGYFYGTTVNGGTNGVGTIFKLTVSLYPPANQVSALQFFTVFNTTNIAVLIPSVSGETYQLQYTATMSPANWINTGDPTLSIGGPLILTDIMDAQPSQRFYRAVITP
ncbi:MAG: choice-of-anchor tandem repeat GloVer-containing protein [Verrucomicrobiia bacterium]